MPSHLSLTPSAFLIVLGLLAAILFVWAAIVYNRLVALRQRFQNAFSQIDVQLKRRHNLVPSLVAAVKAAMTHERETLEAVTRARTRASDALRLLDRPENATGLMALASGEEALTLMLSRLLARMEAYPDLKTSANVSQLMEELVSTENRIAFARQAFNDAAMLYNTRRQAFPTVLAAAALKFYDVRYLQFEDRTIPDHVAVDLITSTPHQGA